MKRLAKDSPDVRSKALHAIKYLCQNGRDEFRMDLQRSNEAVRQCSRKCLSNDCVSSLSVLSLSLSPCLSLSLIDCWSPAVHLRLQGTIGSFAW